MPRKCKKYKKIKTPTGFTRYMAKKFKRKIPGLKSPYKFTTWMLTKHMKKSALKRHIAKFKKIKKRRR